MQPKLSKLQKAIILQLNAAPYEERKYARGWDFRHASAVSLKVARQFDKDGSKVFDKRRARNEAVKSYTKRVLLADKNDPEEQARLTRLGDVLSFPFRVHGNGIVIENRFSAAYSRSLRRLEKRGLIHRINGRHGRMLDREILLSENPDKEYLEFYENDSSCRMLKLFRARTNQIRLTTQGRKVAAELLGT
jgi:hypothetical protein